MLAREILNELVRLARQALERARKTHRIASRLRSHCRKRGTRLPAPFRPRRPRRPLLEESVASHADQAAVRTPCRIPDGSRYPGRM